MSAKCGNCGKRASVYIPKSVSTEEWRKTAECTFCGVKGHLTIYTPSGR